MANFRLQFGNALLQKVAGGVAGLSLPFEVRQDKGFGNHVVDLFRYFGVLMLETYFDNARFVELLHR